MSGRLKPGKDDHAARSVPVARLPRRRSYTAGKLAFVIGMVMVVLFGMIMIVQRFQQAQIRSTVHSYREQLAQMEERNRALRDEIDRLSSDQNYIELLARKYLGLVKPEETIFRRRD